MISFRPYTHVQTVHTYIHGNSRTYDAFSLRFLYRDMGQGYKWGALFMIFFIFACFLLIFTNFIDEILHDFFVFQVPKRCEHLISKKITRR